MEAAMYTCKTKGCMRPGQGLNQPCLECASGKPPRRPIDWGLCSCCRDYHWAHKTIGGKVTCTLCHLPVKLDFLPIDEAEHAV